jgi:putative transcriptional regulator
MKSKASRKPRAASKLISSWDDALFDPADLVRDMRDLADHYEGKKKLTLRTFTVVTPVPKFSPAEIVELREARKLSRPLFAQILNVPVVTVRKWESGERMPSGAALRLLQVMRARPDALLQMAVLVRSKKTIDVIRKGRTDHLRSHDRKTKQPQVAASKIDELG